MEQAIVAAGVSLTPSIYDDLGSANKPEESAEKLAEGRVLAVGVPVASSEHLGDAVRAVFDALIGKDLGVSGMNSPNAETDAGHVAPPIRRARRGASPLRRPRNRFRDAWQWGSLRDA